MRRCRSWGSASLGPHSLRLHRQGRSCHRRQTLGDKAHSLVFDNSKIKRFVPEFRCTVSLAEGIRRTLAWLDAHPKEQRLDSNAAVEKILSGLGFG